MNTTTGAVGDPCLTHSPFIAHPSPSSLSVVNALPNCRQELLPAHTSPRRLHSPYVRDDLNAVADKSYFSGTEITACREAGNTTTVPLSTSALPFPCHEHRYVNAPGSSPGA